MHPLGLVIRQEYLARACLRTNYQAVSLKRPHPHSARKWGASSKMPADGRDSGAKEGQEWSHLDMINTEMELNVSDTTGLCCKLQQASAHLHQVIEEGVVPTHTLQSVWCVPEGCARGKALLTLHNLRQHIFKIYTITSWKKIQLHWPWEHYNAAKNMQMDKTLTTEENVVTNLTDNTCTVLKLITHQCCWKHKVFWLCSL